MSAIVNQPMTRILLSGSLAKTFGREFFRQLETGTTREAFSALQHTVEGFADFIRDSARRGLRFAIFRNRKNVGESEFTLSGTTEIRIVPVIAGSKSGGIFQTVLGVAMIVAGVFLSATPLGPPLVAMGISMVIGGVIQMLSPVPKASGQQEQAVTENKPSYLFNGAFNSTQQGLPVPVVYGQMLVGSSVVAIGTWSEAIPA
ncbi:bacteriophage lambda tail assembly I [Pseudomonas fluorescens NCIMB 11764]|uniref:Bacteriophage lambda tail assembly I n=1 Tax=Pseudomonas fluorescens NCIMB 11764 TaxID=1221522 RepID=A0A0K1QL17_PSEFL|nr:tail assembly protein [Pseudomonas fluorescens]AKV06150.1 bacteriophage lambda tail assembly I [Pseudomonas fluorescens NCIMB 11764]